MLNGVREWYHHDGPQRRGQIIDRYTGIVFKMLH